MKFLQPVLSVLGLSFFAIQLVPVERTNPPVETEVEALPAAQALLKRSCYDCHSNETRWPWYSYVAPASWLVADDVRHGRKHLNFSTWNRYDEEKQLHKVKECWEETYEGRMPLWFYLPLHPEATLTDEDVALLKEWHRVEKKK